METEKLLSLLYLYDLKQRSFDELCIKIQYILLLSVTLQN